MFGKNVISGNLLKTFLSIYLIIQILLDIIFSRLKPQINKYVLKY